MKYRKTPQDFIVEEIADHKTVKNGSYKLYSLEKENIETFALLGILSRTFNIPRAEISIAGLKDTHAKTTQFLTIPNKYELKNVKNAKLVFRGYLNNPLKLGNLDGNKFIITVKDIEKQELDKIYENSKSVEFGLPNYYDSQRFGSVLDGKFIGKLLIEKKYEEAVKQYLTGISESDSEQRDQDKENIYNSWPNFDIQINSQDLKKVIQEYKRTKKWIIAYKYIASELRQMFISSYQSYLWNECIKTIMKNNLDEKDLFYVPYAVDELIFNKKEMKKIPEIFQTISHKIIPKDYEREVIEEVLDKEGLSISQFNIRQTGNFFKSSEREVMLYPQEFKIHDAIPTGDTYSVTVEFILGRGSYATMVLKKIFGQ